MMHAPEDHDGLIDKWLEAHPDIRKFARRAAIVVTVGFFVLALAAAIVGAHFL